jgi:K+-sensing histidine kinase KdpD
LARIVVVVSACILAERRYWDHVSENRIGLSSWAVVELIRPVGLCFAAVLVTTSVLSTIDSFVPTEHLMLGYLLPTILVAIHFGSTLAVLTSFAGGLSAAYFLLPPKFSFYVDDPVHIAELGFTILSAVISSKVVGALASDSHRQARIRADEVIE